MKCKVKSFFAVGTGKKTRLHSLFPGSRRKVERCLRPLRHFPLAVPKNYTVLLSSEISSFSTKEKNYSARRRVGAEFCSCLPHPQHTYLFTFPTAPAPANKDDQSLRKRKKQENQKLEKLEFIKEPGLKSLHF